MKANEYERGYRIAGDRLQIGVCEPGGLVFIWSMWLIWPSSGMLTDWPSLSVDGDSWRILADHCADATGLLSVYSNDLDGRVLLGEVERDLRKMGYRNLTGR